MWLGGLEREDNPMKRIYLIGSSVIFAAACATSASGGVSEKAAAKLAQYDATGETTSCIGLRNIRSMSALDDRHFLVKVNGGKVYLNKTRGRCSGAHRNFNRLQYKTSQNRLCRNEIIRVVDNTQGFTVGSCGLGDFERLEKIPQPEEN